MNWPDEGALRALLDMPGSGLAWNTREAIWRFLDDPQGITDAAQEVEQETEDHPTACECTHCDNWRGMEQLSRTLNDAVQGALDAASGCGCGVKNQERTTGENTMARKKPELAPAAEALICNDWTVIKTRKERPSKAHFGQMETYYLIALAYKGQAVAYIEGVTAEAAAEKAAALWNEQRKVPDLLGAGKRVLADLLSEAGRKKEMLKWAKQCPAKFEEFEG